MIRHFLFCVVHLKGLSPRDVLNNIMERCGRFGMKLMRIEYFKTFLKQ
jgi:hypothetical protein